MKMIAKNTHIKAYKEQESMISLPQRYSVLAARYFILTEGLFQPIATSMWLCLRYQASTSLETSHTLSREFISLR